MTMAAIVLAHFIMGSNFFEHQTNYENKSNMSIEFYIYDGDAENKCDPNDVVQLNGKFDR